MKLVWVFDRPFTEDEWPLPNDLQDAMLTMVGNNLPIANGTQLQVVKLCYEGGESGLPGHDDLDPKVYRMPGVVIVEDGDDREALTGTTPEPLFLPQANLRT